MYPFPLSLSPFPPSHPSRLSQSSRLGCLRYIEASHQLFILHMVVYICQRRQWQPTPVLLSGKSDGRRSLVGYSPWGLEELDTTEWLHFHFSLSCIGKGNGNPLQCSYLEDPRDRGARRAAVYGVAQSRAGLKWLSSSSSIYMSMLLPLFVPFSPSLTMSTSLFSRSAYQFLPCK